MNQSFASKLLMAHDDIGTIRTGRQWFDRYMVFPWEMPQYFAPIAG